MSFFCEFRILDIVQEKSLEQHFDARAVDGSADTHRRTGQMKRSVEGSEESPDATINCWDLQTTNLERTPSTAASQMRINIKRLAV